VSSLEIIDLKTHFPTPDGTVRAVDAIALSIREKETFGVIGETGCGKTVPGLSIMRLLHTTAMAEGEIIYAGKNLLGVSEAEMRAVRGEEIAMILQNPTTSLNPVLRVGEQIAEAIQLHQGLNKRGAKEKAVEVLDAVKIPSPSRHANEYPHEFSRGMKQRVMLAMGLACDPALIIADEPTKGLDVTIKAQIVELIKKVTEKKVMLLITHDLGVARILATNPDLIIADEPTSSLDVSVQAQILNLMKYLQKKFDHTYLFISHDLDVVRIMADQIAVMYLGQLVEIRKTRDRFNYAKHPHTQALLSAVTRLTRGAEDRKRTLIRGDTPSPIDIPKWVQVSHTMPTKRRDLHDRKAETCRNRRKASCGMSFYLNIENRNVYVTANAMI